MGTQVSGTLEKAQPSKSGKSVSCTIDGNYYSCKNREIESCVGQGITCDTSVQNLPDGGSITWINTYRAEGESQSSNGSLPQVAQNIVPSKSNDTSVKEKLLPMFSNSINAHLSHGGKMEDIPKLIQLIHLGYVTCDTSKTIQDLVNDKVKPEPDDDCPI